MNCKSVQTDLMMAGIIALERQATSLQQKNTKLQQDVAVAGWGIHRIRGNDKKTRFYTGLPNFAVFMWLFKYVFFEFQSWLSRHILCKLFHVVSAWCFTLLYQCRPRLVVYLSQWFRYVCWTLFFALIVDATVCLNRVIPLLCGSTVVNSTCSALRY